MEMKGMLLSLAIMIIYTADFSQQLNVLEQVDKCPSSGREWRELTKEQGCVNDKTYHCLPHVQPDKTTKRKYYAGCMLYDNITSSSTGECPQVRYVSGDFAFENEKFMCLYGPESCPPMNEKYRSDELYKYPGCLGKNETYVEELYSTTFKPEKGSSGLSTEEIAGIVIGVITGIAVLVIVGCVVRCVVYRKRRNEIPRMDSGWEKNQTNGNAANLQPLVNKQEEKNILEPDAGDSDVQPDTEESIRDANGHAGSRNNQGHTVIHTETHHHHYYGNVTNAETVGNLQVGDGNDLSYTQNSKAD